MITFHYQDVNISVKRILKGLRFSRLHVVSCFKNYFLFVCLFYNIYNSNWFERQCNSFILHVTLLLSLWLIHNEGGGYNWGMMTVILIVNETSFSTEKAESFLSFSHCLLASAWGSCDCTAPGLFFPAFISEPEKEVSRRLTRSELDTIHRLCTRGSLRVTSTLRPCIWVA